MITMEIENFSGNSKLQTRLESFQWGTRRVAPNRLKGQGSYLPVEDVQLTRFQDEHSAQFMNRAVRGPAFPKVVIRLSQDSGGAPTPYLEITLFEVLISSYQISGAGSGPNKPLEAMAFNFNNMEFKQL